MNPSNLADYPALRVCGFRCPPGIRCAEAKDWTLDVKCMGTKDKGIIRVPVLVKHTTHDTLQINCIPGTQRWIVVAIILRTEKVGRYMPIWFRPRGTVDRDNEVLPLTRHAVVQSEIEAYNEEARMTMAINHMVVLVLVFYGLYAICRYGFGWDPARDPPPPTYTLHIPGITG